MAKKIVYLCTHKFTGEKIIYDNQQMVCQLLNVSRNVISRILKDEKYASKFIWTVEPLELISGRQKKVLSPEEKQRRIDCLLSNKDKSSTTEQTLVYDEDYIPEQPNELF